MRMKDRVAIITGATRGIGKSVLYRFAEEGAIVIGVYASSEHLARQIEDELRPQGVRTAFFKGSITDRDFVRRLMEQVYSDYGKIDVLINNAGIVADNFTSQMSLDEWDRVYRTNFEGTYSCCIEAIPYMERQGSGKIVNVISVTGVLGREAQTNYGTSKGSIIGLTRMLARRYASKGIYVNAIAPGMINTEMIGHVPKDKLDNFLVHTDLKRLGESREIADSVLFLSGEMSDYIAGGVLKVDGGFMR
ncbi:SDR family NAD(P)-dependent oxidoreductase [Paenibacillus filicis]|uniref:SDR family NAD(P)-dependent oxidoreductase n=1 Tax=Paenibacillus gyeongsangnamensis TaxID=3388067 RepID=A0ABT4Q8E6_9BACL|nr:SDR family NAD(P)-dependent oxidoreductase [Paenibacillus filicis]MCZ8513159.1 SDR family NAD(P)-dependent oxidoreductase [Paenibacillus filicis]